MHPNFLSIFTPGEFPETAAEKYLSLLKEGQQTSALGRKGRHRQV
jgi:hypothetical protein